MPCARADQVREIDGNSERIPRSFLLQGTLQFLSFVLEGHRRLR